jgi:hypothetical protein
MRRRKKKEVHGIITSSPPHHRLTTSSSPHLYERPQLHVVKRTVAIAVECLQRMLQPHLPHTKR